VLLHELRRHYSVDEMTEAVLSPPEIEQLQERGMSIVRPLEAVLTILRQV
jgi:hypothetical protein